MATVHVGAGAFAHPNAQQFCAFSSRGKAFVRSWGLCNPNFALYPNSSLAVAVARKDSFRWKTGCSGPRVAFRGTSQYASVPDRAGVYAKGLNSRLSVLHTAHMLVLVAFPYGANDFFAATPPVRIEAGRQVRDTVQIVVFVGGPLLETIAQYGIRALQAAVCTPPEKRSQFRRFGARIIFF